jgi:hypothetical protein
MIFWIASYPKSGNTWIRTLISAYYYSKDGDFKNGECLKFIDQFPQRKYFKDFYYKKDLPGDVAKYWGKAQDLINKENKIKFFKTHSALVKLGDYEFTNIRRSIGCIYIIRDPRNVITSLSNHFELNHEDALKFMLNDKKFTFDQNLQNDFSDFQFISSWKKNYKSWKNNSFIPVKLVKYEDLLEKTFSTFEDIIIFINKTCTFKKKFDRNRAKKAINTTSFDKLKKLEKNYGFLESVTSKKNQKKIPFFFQGPKNDWKVNFDENFKIKINGIFKDDIKIFNY